MVRSSRAARRSADPGEMREEEMIGNIRRGEIGVGAGEGRGRGVAGEEEEEEEGDIEMEGTTTPGKFTITTREIITGMKYTP